MTKRIIVFEYAGVEHLDPVPLALEPDTANYTVTKTYDISMNGDASHWLSLPQFEKREVDLPAWLTTQEFCTGWAISLRYLIAFGTNLEWPEMWLRSIYNLKSDHQRYGCIQLLKANPLRMRSPLRKSLRDQVVTWLESAPEQREFLQPLSERQCEIAMGPYGRRAVQMIATTVYRRRTPWGEAIPDTEPALQIS